MLDRGLSAQRIWQDLEAEHGFADSYQSVQRFVRKLRATSPLPFRRLKCVCFLVQAEDLLKAPNRAAGGSEPRA